MKSFAITLTLLLCLATAGRCQDKNPKDPKDPKVPREEKKPASKFQDRYGYEADLKHYPQTTPKDTLESIIKAIVDERMEYMMENLADPAYVDQKVDRYVTESRRVERGGVVWANRIGVGVSTPDEKITKTIKLAEDQGLVVGKVKPGSPAARAGINEMDILLELDHKKVPNLPSEFFRMLDEFKGKATVEGLVIRNGKLEAIKNLSVPVTDPDRQLAFRKVVRETTNLLFDDAARIQEWRKFAKDAEWKIEGNHATGTLKELGTSRQVFLRLDEDRWFLENRQKEK